MKLIHFFRGMLSTFIFLLPLPSAIILAPDSLMETLSSVLEISVEVEEDV